MDKIGRMNCFSIYQLNDTFRSQTYKEQQGNYYKVLIYICYSRYMASLPPRFPILFQFN